MEITSIKIHIIEGDERLKAFVSIVLNNALAVHDLRIILGNSGYFVAMPNKKGKDGKYHDIVHPINSQTRETFENIILTEFNKYIASEQFLGLNLNFVNA